MNIIFGIMIKKDEWCDIMILILVRSIILIVRKIKKPPAKVGGQVPIKSTSLWALVGDLVNTLFEPVV